MSEQQANIERVSATIAPIIAEFCQERLRQTPPQFHMDDLREFVAERQMVAPASPDRILRDMRQRGALNYRVVSRSKSLYEVLPCSTS